MLKKLPFFIFIFISICSANAQLSDKAKEKLAVALEKHINDERIRVGEKPLSRSKSLAKAALLQASYNSKHKFLSHEQNDKKYRTVSNRVSLYSDLYTAVGENILSSQSINGKLNDKNIAHIAFKMFQGWKNSKGHYANMISSAYSHGDFGFTYNEACRCIYATQVFGKKGIKIPGQLSKNAFGIKEGDVSCEDFLALKSHLLVSIGNSISIEDNDIYFSYYDKSGLKEIFNEKKDGLAIDLILEEQLECNIENQLDVSPIYDGVMLPPIYRDQLFAINKAESDYRLISKIGKVPSSFQGKKFTANVIVIKNNTKCSYITPVTIPYKSYNLKEIPPIWLEPKVELITEGVYNVNEILFDFDAGITTSTNSPKVYNLEDTYSITIKSYTSVDGPTETNNQLHQERASFIENYLKSTPGFPDVPIEIEAKENWELCDYQLEIRGMEDLRTAPKSEIKNKINQNKIDWKEDLFKQRKSKALQYVKGIWNDEDEMSPYYNFTHALLANDHELANKALYKIGKGRLLFNVFDNDFHIEKALNNPHIVQNVSAYLIENNDSFDLEFLTHFVRTWLSKSHQLNEGAQKNLLNLYAFTSRRMLYNWDTSSEDLSKVLHPKKVKPLFDNYKSQEVVTPLFLNFHMASLKYYAQINDDEGILESFKFVTNYYKEASLTLEDDVDLSLFFNSWSVYAYSTELLLNSLNEDRYNEESLFILAQTAAAYPQKIRPKTLRLIHRLSIRKNKKRWCSWIQKDNQYLRDNAMKKLYCDTCIK